MQVLQELLKLKEEATMALRPMELRDFVDGSEGLEDAFPKLLQKKWNTPGGIVWHGLPLYAKSEHGDWNDNGPAMDAVLDAIHEYVLDGYTIEGNITIHNTIDMSDEDKDDDEDDAAARQDSADVDFEMTFHDVKNELKEVWWGFRSDDNAIIVGFDAWPDAEEAFNEAFDEAFEEMTGREHNPGDEEDDAVYNPAWETFKKEQFGFYGLCFAVTSSDGKNFHVEEEVVPMNGGFFRSGVYKIIKNGIDAGKIWVSPHH